MSVSRLLAVVLAVLAVVLAAVAVRLDVGSGGRALAVPEATGTVPARTDLAPSTSHPSVERPSVQRPSVQRPSVQRRALRVLRGWDLRRAAAYRAGSGRRLRGLYAAGSSAGVADVRLLSGYRSRGFTVAGLRTQVLALDVLTSRRSRLEVRVEDRVAAAVAVRGRQRVRLPRDAASARVVALVRSADGRWRVSAVRDAPRTGPG